MSDFKNPGQKVGIEIWRIEKMKAVAAPVESYGTFYSGDCYIVLKTYEKSGARYMDLYFWLGKDSSQDEQGAVAYKTVELDDQLGGKPVQHREVQNHESPEFLGLFPKLKYLDGGMESGFKHVKPNDYKPRLLHLKGKHHVACKQVALASTSMNEGDVFILDNGLTLYQWNGPKANKYEKAKGLEIVQGIKDDERGGKARIVLMDTAAAADQDAFWKLLGGKAGVKPPVEDDDAKASEVHLFRLSDASGSLSITPVGTAPAGQLDRDVLDGNDVFLADDGHQVFVWVGKKTTDNERKNAIPYATQYLQQAGRPAETSCVRMAEGAEIAVFKGLFKNFNKPKPQDFKAAKKPDPKPDDFSAMFRAKQAAEQKMVDDGKGELTIWVIANFDKQPLDKSMYGQFYSGDSYICLYKYFVGTRQMGIIYFWQGRKSSQDEKGASALLTKNLADELAALKPSQVRVVQNAEPSHFLSLFKGKMVIHEGGRASGFSNSAEKDNLTAGETGLYHVRGTSALNTRAVQVDATATSLNSGDCFVLLTPNAAYAWSGVGAADSEKAFAQNTLNTLKGGRPAVVLTEGNEPAEFWEALGGQQEYPSSGTLQSGDYDPRLFQVNNTRGHIVVQEVHNFSQDDLCNDDVMILDAGAEVFVWVGPQSNQAEKDGAVAAALEYVKNLPAGQDTPIFRVDAGFEPPSFTCNFLGWDNTKAQDFSDPYAKKLAAAKLGAAGPGAADEKKAAAVAAPAGGVSKIGAGSVGGQYKDPKTTKYTQAQLKAGADGVDPANKELYLSDAEFKTVFGVTQAEFAGQPGWKKEAAKKKAGLF